jgi:hypothetical protein
MTLRNIPAGGTAGFNPPSSPFHTTTHDQAEPESRRHCEEAKPTRQSTVLVLDRHAASRLAMTKGDDVLLLADQPYDGPL